MILVLGGEKGGSGKSCIAQNLAVWLQRKGNDVLLLDADPQGTSVDWAREREQNPNLQDLQVESAHGDIRKTLLDRAKRYEAIVVDAGGADSVALRSALTVATHALLPFRPKRRDLKTLAHVEELITLAKSVNPELVARAIVTQAPALPSQIQRILDSKKLAQAMVLNLSRYSRQHVTFMTMPTKMAPLYLRLEPTYELLRKSK